MLPLNRRKEVISMLIVYYCNMRKRGEYILLFRLVDYVRKTTCWPYKDRARHEEVLEELNRVARVEPHPKNSRRHIRKWAYRYEWLRTKGELLKFELEMRAGIPA